MLCSLVLLALFASVQGRAVNISNTWVLPEEGFPVFYRYFRDRISWYEADAVCQFHHANLVTVDTTAQYDAVRAYLKELDISSSVWVGLIRSNPDGDFTWTDYRGLSSDGYWSSAPDSRSAPLCAATNPTADYRWEARACGGPTVASFICELPVPQWALGNEGCMVKALPALTILYLPESAAVQLTADCGLAGVKRVQCTGNVKREDLLKDLACVEEEETTTVLPLSSTGTGWSATTDQTFTDQEITTEFTTQEPLTTEHEVDINQPNLITTTIRQEPLFKLTTNVNRNMLMNKNIDLSDNNAQSNFIPKTVNEENILTNDQLEKLEDERHMQHKMLHEEIARVGNVENIFNQPTDHFIPPLVMAKARISDDMTVLSLAEKHAQQLAEKQFNRHYQEIDHIYNHSGTDKVHSDTDLNSEKPLISSIKLDKLKDVKKDFKTNLPKKYVNDKYYDTKTKSAKVTEFKTVEKDKLTEQITSTESLHEDIKTSTSTGTPMQKIIKDQVDEENMDLTVILKDANLNSEEHNTYNTNYTGDIVKLDSVVRTTNISEPIILSNVNNSENNSTSDSDSKIADDVIMDHEVIKITIIDDETTDNAKVFEVTTKVPIFKDETTDKILSTSTFIPEIHIEPIHTTETHLIAEESTTLTTVEVKVQNITVPETISTTVGTINPITEHTSTVQVKSTESTVTTVEQITVKPTTDKVIENSTLLLTNTDHHIIENINNTTASNITAEESNNFTETHDEFDSNDSHGRNDSDSEEDFQSPLLSGANEPLHRPPRTRRPQQGNRKFNPFRILG